MSVLEDLRGQRRLYAQCPNCQDEFRLADADLFDATKPLSGRALQRLDELRQGVREQREDFAKRKLRADQHTQVVAEAVNIGKVVEKIAPSLPGFPVSPGDCRSLLEPIDYLVFKGLAATGKVDALIFVDVKSGNARLSKRQKTIRDLVECGKVSLTVTEAPEEGEP
jgi:predicted Holliday junction resolvase-like endonuclease